MDIVLIGAGLIFGHFFSWQMNIVVTAAALILGALLWQKVRKRYSAEAFVDFDVAAGTAMFLVGLWIAHFLSVPALQTFLGILGWLMGLIPPSFQEFMLK